MAELVADRTWAIQGRTITLPVRITHAEGSLALFRADPEAAGQHLGGTGLTPFTVGGRAVSVLLLAHYGEWALGSYDEVGIGLLVHGPGLKAGLHLLDLPVTGEFTREAGQDFWGLPKWLMRAHLTFAGRTATVEVHDGDTFVLRAHLVAGRMPVPFRATLPVPVWARIGHGAQAGRLLRGTVPLAATRACAGRGRLRLDLGVHPMALRMVDLGMTAPPLWTVHAGRMTAVLDAFTAVGA